MIKTPTGRQTAASGLVRESAETLAALSQAVHNAQTALDAQDQAVSVTCQGFLSPLLSKRLYQELTGTTPLVRSAMLNCLKAVVHIRGTLDEVLENEQDLGPTLEGLYRHCDQIESSAQAHLTRVSALTGARH